MNQDNTTVSITVLDKEYKVKCPNEKIPELRAAAEYLDHKMREVSQNSKLHGFDRIAVIAALNVTHELMMQKRQNSHYIEAINQRILDLQHKVDEVLK